MGTDPPASQQPPADIADADPLAGTDECWRAPSADGPVRALVRIPGSKSITNRALVLAALAEGPTVITEPLVARDTRLMAAALRALGCRIDESADSWLVEPSAPGGLRRSWPGGTTPQGPPRSIEIDVGNAGTVLRFVPPVAALTTSDVMFRGDARVSQRPVAPLLAALRGLGAQIADDGSGRVPFTVHGRGTLRGGTVVLDASSSSQLVSGLLLAAPRFDLGAEIRHDGPPVPSAPHIEMTMQMLRASGVQVTAGSAAPAGATGANTWQVIGGPISPGRIAVEPDLSNALPFLAAAMVTGGEVTIASWPTASLQPAVRIIELLSSMGATVRHTVEGLRVSGSGQVHGVAADLSEVGELTPVLAALAVLATSPSEFTGIAHLRRHESDRLGALATEMGKLGCDVTELADGLRIRPRPLRAEGVVFDSHDDHRLVMAAAVVGLATGGLGVRNAAAVGKTFPGFGRLWSRHVAGAG